MDRSIELKNAIQDEALEAHAKMNYCSIICLSVALGKSVVAIKRIRARLLSNPELKVLFFSAREIHLDNFKRELKKFDLEFMIDRIKFCCTRSVSNLKDPFDLVIFDEAHLEISQYVNFLEIQFFVGAELLGLTGTPKDGKYSEDAKRLYRLCPISYTKQIDDAISMDLTNDYRITVITHDLESSIKTIKLETKNGIFEQTERQRYSYLERKYHEAPNFWTLIQIKKLIRTCKTKTDILNGLITLLPKEGDKLLVYGGSIEQCKQLSCPAYHSNLSAKIKKEIYEGFYNGDFSVMGNIGGIRESVTIPGLNSILIGHLDSSETTSNQSLGRILRLSPAQLSNCYILMARDTLEESWVKKSLKQFDIEKIRYIELKDFLNEISNKTLFDT